MRKKKGRKSENHSDALERLKSKAQVENVTWRRNFGTPHFIYGRLSNTSDDKADTIVNRFISDHGDLFGIKSDDEYEILYVKEDSFGNRHVRVGRLYQRYRIYPSRLNIWVDPAGVIIRVKAHWPLIRSKPVLDKKINIKDALKIASKARPKDDFLGIVGQARIELHSAQIRQTWRLNLAWNFVAQFVGNGPSTEGFIISATDGKILRRYDDEDDVGTTTTGYGINNQDETATSPERTINVDDPGGTADLRLLDQTRSVDIETRDMNEATSGGGTYSYCADDDSDGVFKDITNSPRSDSDRPEVDAHYNTGLMHDYLARSITVNGISLFNRTGWKNDATQKWISLVHRSTNSESSFFSRTYKLTMHGDGDGPSGTHKMTYKSTLDTCAHEWAHALQSGEITGGTNANGGFDSVAGENFVLQEATADMFACCINKDWGWRFGAVFEDDASLPGATHASTGSRLRGMRVPSNFTQPDHFYANGDTLGNGFAGTTGDYTRTGILGKAAFLMAAGGTHPASAGDPTTYPPIPVYGMGISAFENILYYTIVNVTDPADVFSDFRQDMIDAANTLYPSDPCKANTVSRAFDAVGIYASGTTPPAIPSGPDPMITPWGATTDVPPYWQSPDIYVKDTSDVITAPLKGQVNRLFANITNIGDAEAENVSVTFSFRPYGAGSGSTAEKTIGTAPLDDVPAGTSVEFEIAWDLTDLTDTNGGAWALPISALNHFCVRVQVTYAGDVDTCNNYAQNNFGNVGTASGDGEEAFMIGNSNKEEARWVALIPVHRISKNWKVELDIQRLFKDTRSALSQLASQKQFEIPWTADNPDAIIVPMNKGGCRATKFKWKIDSREKYDGPVYGCLIGRPQLHKQLKEELIAEITSLVLMKERFEIQINGRIKGMERTVCVRGKIDGVVDTKSGKFKGKFLGLLADGKREKKTRFAVTGVMGVSASYSFVVVNGIDAEQGIELGIPVIGNFQGVCKKSQPKMKRRRRKRILKKTYTRKIRRR